MNEGRYLAVKNAVFLRCVEKEGLGLAGAMAESVAIGVETALAWPVKADFLTEEEVITGARQHRYEKELENQLDTVLRYVELRDGWIAQDDREGRAEFRNLALEVQLIAEVRKARKGAQ